MSFHGGLAGTIIAMTVFSLRRKIPMLSLFDVAAASVTFGLFFGRIANFINGELWGRPTDLPWGIVFPNAGPLPRHPSQLYEAGLEGILLFIVLRVLTHSFLSLTRPGMTGGAFIAGYGARPHPCRVRARAGRAARIPRRRPHHGNGAFDSDGDRRDRDDAAVAAAEDARERHAARPKTPPPDRSQRPDERRRLHGALPDRPRARLLRDARSVRSRAAISSPRRKSARCSERSSAPGWSMPGTWPARPRPRAWWSLGRAVER